MILASMKNVGRNRAEIIGGNIQVLKCGCELMRSLFKLHLHLVGPWDWTDRAGPGRVPCGTYSTNMLRMFWSGRNSDPPARTAHSWGGLIGAPTSSPPPHFLGGGLGHANVGGGTPSWPATC